jgi:predicted ATPase
MDRFVIISGCSGGGKSTLLCELARRGYNVVPEPGRRIIEQERLSGGSALPWVDMGAFARRAIAMALDDRAAAKSGSSWVFFDRSLIDAAASLEHSTGEPALGTLKRNHRYNRRVFLTPPWPEIYRTDAQRRHGWDSAKAEYERLLTIYPGIGYDIAILPKISLEARADYVLDKLNACPRRARHIPPRTL